MPALVSNSSCFFPSSSEQHDARKRPLSVRVNLQQLPELQKMVDEEARHEELHALLQSAWALVLHCYTGMDEVCFGFEESGGRMKGPSITQMTIENEYSLREIVAHAREDIGKHSRGNAADHHLYDTSVLIRYGQSTAHATRPVMVGQSQSTAMPEEHKLRLLVKVLKSGISLFLEYRTSQIPTDQAKNIAGSLNKIISEILGSPDLLVGTLDFLSTRDQLQIEKWNSESLPRIDNTIHGTIEDNVPKLADKQAICSWDGTLTYSELDGYASKLASHLADLGVRAEVFVPLCFEKSKWNIVAMLAVLKAGGAFVPLDPTYPKDRMIHLTESVNAKVLLCSRLHVQRLGTYAETVLPIDATFIEDLPAERFPLEHGVDSHNAAYIIPTSGTTGVPKLTLIEHGNYCTGVHAHAPGMLMDSTLPLRVLQFASHSFDASLVEILTPLMIGGTVCIPDESSRLNDIAKVINEMQVTWTCLTPTFVRFLEPSMVPSLKTIALVGEAMSQANLDTWTKIDLVNGYGPSECSVAAVTNPNVTKVTDPKNIGYPVGCHAWVVHPNNHNQLVPIGCVGELLAEGHTVARCYFADEEKTSQSFIKNLPWTAARESRGYLTGDLVIQNPNGSFNFVGRKDTQVKYHGQRIELPEIEHHINADTAIKHALVTLPHVGYCKERLVSIVSLTSEMTDSDNREPLSLLDGPEKESIDREVADIRERLSQKLPVYMLPTTWIVVNTIPSLASGKLDRRRVAQWLSTVIDDLLHRALSAKNRGDAERESLTDIERTLILVCAHVLNLPGNQISVTRSFLSLGGDSISAMQVMAFCQKQSIGLTVQDILRSKSISDLALAVTDNHAASYDGEEEIGEPFALSPIQQLYYQLPNQGNGHFNQSFYLRLSRRVTERDLRLAIETLISRHSMLRARFEKSDGVWRQRVTDEIQTSYHLHYSSASRQANIDDAITHCQRCLDSSSGPLFAAELFDFQDQQHAFLVGHHLVIDLVSWRVILGEIEDLLNGSALLPPPIAFSTWCQLQADHSQTLKLEKVLPRAPIPAFDPSYWGVQGGDNTYGNATHVGFELNEKITSSFLHHCHDALTTEPVDVLLASLIHAWSQVFTDRAVPAIYNEGHGREPWKAEIDISRTVGWFTTVYPIYIDVPKDPILTVRRVKDFRRKIPANGRPYFASKCLTAHGRNEFRNHWPWEISFNYLGQYQQLERSGALLQPISNLAGETRGAGGTADVGFNTPRFGLFEISAVIVQGQLRFWFSYNRNMQHQDRIQLWIEKCQETLESMIDHLSVLAPQPTLSDFPLMQLTEDRFRVMLDRLSSLGISPTDIEDVYPCSNMQEGLLLSQTKDAGFYAAVTVHKVKVSQNSPNWEQLSNAWRIVVQRHAALRTIFLENLSSDDGLYDQVVLKQVTPNTVHIDCKEEGEAFQLLEAQRLVSYDNGRSPPHRFTICTTASGDVFCSLEISHTIMDGHSMSVIFQDLRQAYDGQPQAPAPLYHNYIDHLQKQDLEASLNFWKKYLDGSEVCSFPVLNDGVLVPRKLQSIRLAFDDFGILDIQRFCNDRAITLSNVFHVAWALTLKHYIGSNDVTFGYLTSARDAVDIRNVEEIVGPLINTLVCRVKFSQDKGSLFDTLQEVQRDYMNSLPHRYTSLAEVQHTMELAGSNLFNTAISYRRLPPNPGNQSHGLEFEETLPIYDPTEYPVSLNIEVSEQAAMVDLDYWTDHLSSGQAANVATTFTKALQNIITFPDQALPDLDPLSPKQLRQIQEWNNMPETLQDCVHARFAKQARAQPTAPAICAFDGDYTYAELDSVTERLASYLVELGVGPEVFVPTCFDKSCFTIIAMLAVLKAGGACVPLDATHPKAALESRVEDTEAHVVLSSPTRYEVFEDIVPDVVVVDNVLLDDLPDPSSTPACVDVQPCNPAFVIFTSGSTGRPKGVVLEHAAMVTSANAHGSNLGVGPGTRFLQFASYTFDNSLEEMFTTLSRGGCVCVPSEEQRMNNLAEAINELQANFMDLTPTFAALLNPTDVPTIKGMALGGEALTKAVIDQWGKHVHLHGQYGPSEASINSAWKDFKHGGEATNIGRAIGSVSWIVDPEDRNCLVPIGCKGELLIEGPILSRGYLKDPAKTAEAFIENPPWATKSPNKKRRFYCTGDLVNYTSEGEMMYLGRKDSQVKLNGQRIELGEIEHHLKLNLHTEAQSAVELVTVPGKKTIKALAAFLCLTESGSSDANKSVQIARMTDEIRLKAKMVETALSNALPSYYVPSMFIPVTGMPLTTSGKLDRKVLRQLVQTIDEGAVAAYRLSGKSGRAPSGHVETALAGLWETILKLDRDTVGAEDSFFRLGGDSIGAMRLVTASRRENIILTVASIFSQPKLMDMAATATVISSEETKSAQEIEVIPFEMLPEPSRHNLLDFAAAECGVFPDAIEDIYPCTSLQEGLIALSEQEPGAYVAETIYKLPPNTNTELLREAWASVVSAEPILRTRIIYTEDHGFLQVVIREPIVWFNISDLSEIKETDRHLPKQRGGLLTRYVIVGEDSRSPHLIWTAHHAIYDGWSLPLMLSKVEACYRLRSRSALETVPYSRFIRYLRSINSDESDKFWMGKMAEITAPQFPQLVSTSQVQASSQLEHQIAISRAPGADITLPSMIRAAWGLLLATYSGSDDVLWGETNSGREVPVFGIDDILGPTITTSPMRLKINRQITVQAFLQEVQKQSNSSLPFQFAGLQHIKKLNADTAQGCDFQNLLAINAADTVQDSEKGLWDLQSTGTIGTNFFTYPLVVNCTVTRRGVDVELHYDVKVIPEWLVQRLAYQLDHILQRLNSAHIEDEILADFKVLSPIDEATISSWNNRPINSINKCIHNVIFQEQAVFRPSVIAIDSWDMQTTTYKELDERATRLASKLVASGVKPRSFVPLCFDKSGWVVVAMLAILKAGAAFVPLDFEAPLARLREIVKDVNADLVLCSPKYQDLCQKIPIKAITVDRYATEKQPSRLYALPYIQSETPAYVIFTSGSTGKPKGAVIYHASFVSNALEFGPALNITSASRVLQFASYAFDASLVEILCTLMMGGTVCIPNQEARTNNLIGVMNNFNINLAFLTPSLVRTIKPAQVPSLSTLVLVGEAMSQQDLYTWTDKLRLINAYGPTETSVVATVNPSMTTSTNPANLGRAVGSRSWIVSKNNHHVLLPIGAVGELIVEGSSLGAGYLNNPEKTAEVFITNVRWAMKENDIDGTSPRKFYKTGDLVKYNEDGTMIFLGRKDFQTKVRGQRLELSEVEHHLVEDSLVQNAFSSVPSSGPCAKRLVGVVSLQELATFRSDGSLQSAHHSSTRRPLHILPNEAASTSIDSIRTRLCERLPAYMIPSLWVVIEDFPLLPSGKLDRRRTTQWLEGMNSDTYYRISTIEQDDSRSLVSGVESKLQAIFGNALDLPSEQIRLSQSFLHLGGDSISAMQVSSQCRAQGLGNITVQDIIRSKSISELASKAASAQGLSVAQSTTKDSDIPFDLTPIQTLFFQCVGDAYNHFNQSVVLRLSHRLELQDIADAIQTLIATHSMLRAKFDQDSTGTWRQRIANVDEKTYRIRTHHISKAITEHISPLLNDSQASLDITHGPLLSVDIFEIEENYSQAISIVVHHLIIDVVSWGIVLDDLQNLLSGNKPAPQSLSFRAWSQAQSDQARQETASKVFPLIGVPLADLDYWGMSEKPNTQANVITEEFELSPKDSMLLLGAQDALATEPLDVFIASLLESFRKVFPDRSTAAIHNEGHGRQPIDVSQDLSRTIGWFTTLSPVHLPVSPEDTTDIISTIRWVKDLRERIPDKGRPYFAYRSLTKEGQERFTSHWPAEITFNYLGRMQHFDRKDALLQRLNNISTLDIASDVPRFSLFEVTAGVAQGSIKFSFSYNRLMQRQPAIKTWVTQCRNTLMESVEQLLQSRPEPTLTAFKLLPLTYNGISKLSAALPSDVTLDSIEDIYPASPMQQGILLSQLKNPELYAYHAIFEVKSTESDRPVSARRLADAWQVVVHRHPALRTMFIESISKTGLQDQIVLKNKAARLSWILDVSDKDLPNALRLQDPIDYRDQQPPHRLTLCRTKTDRVWCKLEISHAISDGGSMPNLLRDLADAYEGKLSRSDSGPLYSDFIAHLQSSSRDADMNYWKAYLSGIEPCQFPTLNDGKPGMKELGSYELELHNPAAFQSFCRKHGVTLSNVLQLGWALLLHCYVGSKDVSFGVIASGRDIPVRGIENAVGCFVNMLICRINLGDDASILGLLEQLQTDSVNAMTHQSCSLADVQHELQLLSLFNTIFTFQKRQLSKDPEKTSLMFESVEAADPGEYHLTINTDVNDNGITVDFGYWKDKICLAQIQHMVEAFEHILGTIITCPDTTTTVGDLDFVTHESLNTIGQWNRELPSPIRRCIHDMIQEQALIRPRSAQAIQGWDASFTYQELDEVSNQLASYLSMLGVTTDTFVPILSEKSSWAIVSMVAIMKAGGAYVPLDPSHPPSRLRQLIGDVGAKVVLCSRKHHARAEEVAKTVFIVDHRSVEQLPPIHRNMFKPTATPESAAYCLFTSGTTGMPKGTVIQHYAFCTSAFGFTRAIYMDASSRTLQFASYTFDASCAEIFGALIVGACVCVLSEEDRMNNLPGAIRKLNATWAFLTPSVASTIKPERVPCLKTLVTGGEAMTAPLVTKWGRSKCLVNGYGPTETSVFAVIHTKTAPNGEIVNTDHGTIGFASGSRCWIVHPRDHNKLMPIGSVGELIIEGHSTAREYLGDEVKTAKVFIKDPGWTTSLPSHNGSFSTERMYKSGDLVRYNSDGSIGYIGRKDTQIKLNGQRIELGEIEYHVKAKLPENIDSAVDLVAPASRNANKALAAFFNMEDDQAMSSSTPVQPISSDLPAADEILLPMDDFARDLCKSLENSLAGVLPTYMIPSIFIPIKKMPWTSAGKLDRHRLKNVVQNLSKETLAPYRLANVVNKRKPKTETERKLQKLVCSVLNLQPADVGADDSFIRLGGDSVAAMRLVAAAQAEHIELSVIDIFKQPKLSDLAAKCTSIGEDQNTEVIAVPFQLLRPSTSTSLLLDEVVEHCRISRDHVQDAYPASPLQEGFIALSIKQPGAYVAQHILELHPSVDLRKLKAAWQRASENLDLLRTRIVQLQMGEFVQVVLNEDPITWQQASDLQQLSEDTLQIPPHNGGPLSRYTIVEDKTTRTRYFVWSLHHAIYDGWCMPLMLQRVEQIYRNGSSDSPRAPYSRFIKYLNESDTNASLAFWKTKLADASPLQFPQRPHTLSDMPPNGQALSHVAHIASHRYSDITPSTIIRAAWALLLAAYTGSDDVVFGETLTGRDIAVPGITDMCGPTLTTVPTRVKITRNSTVLEFLNKIASNVTDRIPHQHVGLSDIKRIDSDTTAACDFQNLLAIQTGGKGPSESFWKIHANGIQSNYFTYPLVLECKADKSTIDIEAYYDENIISSWQVQRILHQFDQTLRQLSSVANVQDIKVISEQDLQLIQDWNRHEPVLVDTTISSLFLEQATIQPYATAVSSFDGEFTYLELRGHAARVAQQLIDLGVGPEKLVPICMEKTRWAIVAIMGILLAGGGYVPLSPEHPISRHRQIMQDCNASILLCSKTYERHFAGSIAKIVPINETSIGRLSAPVANLSSRSKPHNICYVLYTSGSTGLPKGVVIEHRAIASSSMAIQKALDMDSSSRVFQFGSFVFDASVMETLCTLTCGATICIPSEEERTRDIAGAINRLRATWTCLTPSVANVIESPSAVPTLKTLAAGAEAMTMETIKKWGQRLQLLNAYGPTEGSIVSVANDKVFHQQDPSNIGHMLQSGKAWIVDPSNPHHLSPVGAVGELCIEGPLLARGYLNNRKKTSEAFIEHPDFMKSLTHTKTSPGRIYRTGDLVRYSPGGSIIYIGRKDNQVKLRGQRMELGEIEHHLQADDRIRSVVVLMPISGPCKQRLAAILSLKDFTLNEDPQQPWNAIISEQRVLSEMNKARERLAGILPSYMIPTMWAVVNSIPKLASSKLDRKQVGNWLDEMSDETYQHILSIESNSAPTIPATQTSLLLQRIWAKVLNLPLERVTLNKSWLSLGGDSITAMQLLARCRKEQINLSLNQILRSKSLAHLAESIGSNVGAIEYSDEPVDRLFELSPIQQMYFNSMGNENDSHFNQSFTLRLSRNLEAGQLKTALDTIVKCHSMLRARFSKDSSGTWQQMIAGNSPDCYRFQKHDSASSKEVLPLIAQSQKSLDFQNGPVFAVDLFNTTSDGQILFLVAHHLVIDMVSWRILLADLEDMLDSDSVDSVHSPLSFQVWCEKQAQFTREQSSCEPVSRVLPYSVQPPNLSFWGMDGEPNYYADAESDTFEMDEKNSTLLLDNHAVLRTDSVDLFLSAIAHSFSRVFINRNTPTIFNEGHGREPWESSSLDPSRTVGWFTSMYPIHVSIGEDEDDVVQTVRKMKDMRRKVPDNGRSYFARTFLTPDGQSQCTEHMPIEVLFNYLGKMQQLETEDSLFQSMEFAEREEAMISDFGAKTSRPALFEVSVSVVHNKVRFFIMYNRLMKNQKGIRRWIAECQRTLEEIAKRLSKIQDPQPTLSDFPLLPLDSYDRLAKVVKTLPSAGVSSFGDVEDIYPCASMQEGMILTQIKDPKAYLSYSIFEARAKAGRVDTDRLERAWQKVVERHPALRTVFVDSVCRGGVFDQIVTKKVESGAVTISCRDNEIMDKLHKVDIGDLNGRKKPRLPHQFTICQSNSGKTVVKMEINHAVIDGGSHAVIVKDLQEAYENRLPEGSGPLYSDYIKYIRSQPAGSAINYWKSQLRGLKPCYFPATKEKASKPRQWKAQFMKFDRYADLQRLAETSNVTFSCIMLAAWAMVLRSYTGSNDICFGYLTSGRNIPIDGIQDAVGAFINMLVSRMSLTSSQLVQDVVERVQNNFIESLPYQHCSLAQFQHDLGLAGKALFNTAVSVQNHSSSGDGPPSNIEFEEVEAFDPNEFVITVNIEAGRNDEGVLLTYWTNLVSEQEAEGVASTLARILGLIADKPDRTISELDHIMAIPEGTVLPEVLVKSAAPLPPPTLHIPAPLSPQPKNEGASTAPDWSHLVRSIVNEVVPQILSQMFEKGNLAVPNNDPAAQMVGMITRKASQSLNGPQLREFRSAVETGSIRSRRMSVKSISSDAENRINAAADMVAAAGVLATESFKSVPPDFVEKKLLSIWSELLDMVEDSIGTEDSFFQLGGDSIIAMRLVGAAREEGLSMTVADVFKNPTFADMARVVRVAGEVIDQVMTQAGETSSLRGSIKGSIREASGSQNKPTVSTPAVSAWRDFQALVDDSAIADDDGPAERSPTSRIDREQTDQLFKKWQGFTSQLQNEASPKPALRGQPPQKHQRSTVQQTIHEDPTSNKSVSLLGDPSVDSVISKVQVFKGGISDVLPVTDFQALAITGTLLESKWMLNYFYLDGSGPLDLRKFKQSAFRLVQAFDILRTVFVPYGDRFLQVVLRKLQPGFIYQETDMNLDTFTDVLRQKDREHGPRLGETFVQFIVAKQKKTEHHRIFMRISHAQYDGYCLPKILGSLQAGYNGQPVSSAPSFGNYVRESAKTVAGAHEYWREHLQGSKMTDIVHRYGPNYQRSAGRTSTLKQIVTMPSLSHLNITQASVVKAAWSSTLAQITSEADVVFGHVISGRNGAVPNVENIVGPCLNMVPVRVPFQSSWTVLSLLRYIQDQQISNMPFESLGFREITKHCTDWPDWTNFSSVLQHNQNIHEDGAMLQLGSTKYRVGAVGSQEDFADFSVLSTAKGGDQLEVTLTYAPNTTITADYAQTVFDMLCTTIITFAEDPYTLLPSPSELISTDLRTVEEKVRRQSNDKAPVTLPSEPGVSESEVFDLSDRLRNAWEQILRDDKGTSASPELSSDFFELGGDIMGLAQLTSILEQEGLKIRVEDLIDKSTFVDQVGVLATELRKEKEKEGESPWGKKQQPKEEEDKKKKGEEEEKKKKKSGVGSFFKRVGFGRKKMGPRSKSSMV